MQDISQLIIALTSVFQEFYYCKICHYPAMAICALICYLITAGRGGRGFSLHGALYV